MIERIEIKIFPYRYDDNARDLRITLFVDGKEYLRREILQKDDLESFFEQVWVYVGRRMLAEIKAAKVAQKGENEKQN